MNKTLSIFLTLILATTILPASIQCTSEIEQTSKDLGVEPLFQHRDTPLLDLDGSPLNGTHAWDVVHHVETMEDLISCDICSRYCGFASIAMINHWYGGNISQNRLAYHVNTSPDMMEPWLEHPEEDLLHGGLGTKAESTKTLSWALDDVEILFYDGKPSLDEIKQWINENRPIKTLKLGAPYHSIVIDGYDGSYVHVINPWYGSESRILYDELNVLRVWVPPTNATARNDEPEIWMDSDSDGIVDFDETNRFFTDPYSNDTDGDGIDDKTEIRSYTFLGNGTFDSEDVLLPDVDEDGLRAELDSDSDNGGCPDGLEDLNKNGVYDLDLNETDPFNPEDDPPYLIGDINDDGVVDIYDVVTVSIAFGSKLGDDNWNPIADIAEPYGEIDIYDVVTVTMNFGRTIRSNYSVSGTVYYSTTPLDDVNVELVQDQPTNPPLESTTTINGHYYFSSVLSGSYWIKAYGPTSEYIGWVARNIEVETDDVEQDINLPKKITLFNPENNAIVTSLHPTLSWEANSEAVEYTIQINVSEDWQLVEMGHSVSVSYTVQQELIPGVEYAWQVDAYGHHDEGHHWVGTTQTAFRFTVSITA